MRERGIRGVGRGEFGNDNRRVLYHLFLLSLMVESYWEALLTKDEFYDETCSRAGSIIQSVDLQPSLCYSLLSVNVTDAFDSVIHQKYPKINNLL